MTSTIGRLESHRVVPDLLFSGSLVSKADISYPLFGFENEICLGIMRMDRRPRHAVG